MEISGPGPIHSNQPTYGKDSPFPPYYDVNNPPGPNTDNPEFSRNPEFGTSQTVLHYKNGFYFELLNYMKTHPKASPSDLIQEVNTLKEKYTSLLTNRLHDLQHLSGGYFNYITSHQNLFQGCDTYASTIIKKIDEGKVKGPDDIPQPTHTIDEDRNQLQELSDHLHSEKNSISDQFPNLQNEITNLFNIEHNGQDYIRETAYKNGWPYDGPWGNKPGNPSISDLIMNLIGADDKLCAAQRGLNTIKETLQNNPDYKAYLQHMANVDKQLAIAKNSNDPTVVHNALQQALLEGKAADASLQKVNDYVQTNIIDKLNAVQNTIQTVANTVGKWWK